MLLPKLFGEDLFDDMDEMMRWPDEKDFFGKRNPLYGKNAKNLMKTDIREKDDTYEVDIDLPGFKKDEITVSLENGILQLSVRKLEPEKVEEKNNHRIAIEG